MKPSEQRRRWPSGWMLVAALLVSSCARTPRVPDPEPPGDLVCILWAVEGAEKIEVGRGYWRDGAVRYVHDNPRGLVVDVIEWPE